jgi:hypothetical protein
MARANTMLLQLVALHCAMQAFVHNTNEHYYSATHKEKCNQYNSMPRGSK